MYATEADMVKRFADDIEELKLMHADAAVSINEALQDAAEEINGYIGGRYPLPLPNVPSNLNRMACDIARYRLYYQQPTEEVRNRYKDAIKFLERVQDEKAHLQIQTVTNEIVDDQPKGRPTTMPIGTSYIGGVFGDETLDKMPSFK
ncbi:gp436 family protein [Acinetobacter radioresistens]|uniref:gp436 family protein n=1 Tax=Acinetobacter radioresistens TaxID=40216 RepID=UPI003A7FA780